MELPADSLSIGRGFVIQASTSVGLVPMVFLIITSQRLVALCGI